jgi:tetratricopeptide (TPR) repeat protein
MLVPLLESPGLDRARLSMRIALYWARLGHADDALAALREAAAYDPEDPLIHELQATVHGWAPRTTSASSSAEAYLRGAERRAKRRDHGAAFQDLLRAFDTAPELTESAASLASAFVERNQPAIADEVWRRHGDALIDAGHIDRGCAVHRQRLARFLAARSYEEALAAAFDARLDAAVDATILLALLERF